MKYIFILYLNRSGSTFLSNQLSKLSEILVCPEAEVLASTGDTHKIQGLAREWLKNKGVDVALRALSLLPKEAKKKIIYSIAGDGEEKEEGGERT